MKTLVLLLLLAFVAAPAFAQFDSDRALHLAKVEKYRKMKKTGKFLTLTGSALNIIGLVTLFSTTTTTTYNGYGSPQTTTSGNPEAGLAAYLVGYGMLGAGIPLWIVGGVNEGRYQRKLDNFSVKLNVNTQSSGLSLTYKF